MQRASASYTFGRFHLDSAERRLLRDGQVISLTPKAFDTLLALVQHSGHALTKDELMRAVWPNGFVEEVNLAYNISILRKALADRQAGERYIETVPKLGYRFVAPVQASPSRLEEGRVGVRTNLPAQLTRFIGREREIAEVADAVQVKRLVTLTGAGGVGKTRLALEVASTLEDAFPDSVWLIEFAPIADAELVTHAVAAALDVTEQPGASLLDLLLARLRNWQALLIFDNCEHLVAACAALAERLLHACPHLHILATSREPLRIEGEVTWRVPSLTDEEAVQLFIERACANQPQFEVTASNAAAIAQICRQLDGIPLAIELAAARVTTLSVEQIAARLGDRFGLLASGSRTALQRHQTLKAAIAWSVGMLSPPEQKLLSQLSVFAGGFTAEAAEAISNQLHTLDLLSKLVDKSLVVADVRGEAAHYHLLETIRQFAFEELREAGGADAARDRHMAYFLKLAEEAEIGMRGEKLRDWGNRLEQDLDNLRAALMWSYDSVDFETGLRLAGALWLFWCVHDHAREGLAWVNKLLEAGADAAASVRTKALSGAAMLEWRTEDWLRMSAFVREFPLSPDSNDSVSVALSLICRGWLNDVNLNSEHVQSMYEEALGLFRAAQHAWGVGLVTVCLGEMFMERGECAKAEVVLQENLSLFRTLDWWLLTRALYMLVGAALAEGDLTRAKALAQHRLAIGREDGQIRMCCRALRELGHVALQEGDYQQAMALFDECVALFRKAGHVEPNITHALADLGFVAQIQGDYETATQRFNEALAFYQEIRNVSSIGHVQACLGYIALAQSDLSNARLRFIEGVKQLHKIGFASGVAVALAGMGRIAQVLGRARQAAKLCGFAAEFSPILRVNWMPVELAGYERIITDARARLDDVVLAAAWQEGAAMTLDQAVALALSSE